MTIGATHCVNAFMIHTCKLPSSSTLNSKKHRLVPESQPSVENDLRSNPLHV
ncbi:hypothetical protein K443DRAFT_686589 [Laccaria amethystina LaAM-08-1]|uniref:Uncharacterized protein n=1 Tax=Laccaria amethystina LaAM-08-1 TaxID=1095629 RepID=A0A0C9X2D5_9AGAR|nr:hypothetical protein K443DRAFT_686589 [Laccaria amethystina LaAM-08-1]